MTNSWADALEDAALQVRRFGRLIAMHLLLTILKHPWRFAALVIGGSFLAWLSGL